MCQKPLTDKEIAMAIIRCKDPITMGRVSPDDWRSFVRAIEAAHGIKETCYCDENNIGLLGVSCGDCPTRDYMKSTGE